MKTTSYIDDLDGLSGVAHDYDGIEEDIDLPLGWVEVIVREVVKNPDYDDVMAEYEARMEQAKAQAFAGVDESQHDLIEATLATIQPPPDIDEWLVGERVYHVSGANKARVLAPFVTDDDDATG